MVNSVAGDAAGLGGWRGESMRRAGRVGQVGEGSERHVEGEGCGAMRGDQEERYERQLRLRELGRAGQERLLAARVAVVGAGGLGSPALLYLAAAGVGTLGVVDGDRVELSNLNRQIMHRTAALGRAKAESAAAAVESLNPDVSVRVHRHPLAPENAIELLREYDVVVDATDNLGSRYLINDACAILRIPWVHGSVLRFDGQLATFVRGAGPCYRCLFPAPPAPGAVPGTAEVGVLGAVPGVIGALQALEAVKLILGVGTPLCGELLLFGGLGAEFTRVRVARNPSCPACGDEPQITAVTAGRPEYDA